MGESQKFININGLTLTSVFNPDKVRQAMKYKPTKNKVIVASYPKCGTTWTIMIVLLLLRKGEPVTTAKEWFQSMVYLEGILAEKQKRIPKCIKTHLPFNHLTYSPDAKYIYITRNPADCIVSYFHFVQYLPVQDFPAISFDQVFDHFLEGKVIYGDYFDHLLSWYEQRNLPNVLFLTYESMKKDTKASILKIAEFLDESLIVELIADNEVMLNNILHYSSLESMKETVNSYYDDVFSIPRAEGVDDDVSERLMNYYFIAMDMAIKRGFKSSGVLVRKGEIGEGKATLSEEQTERLNVRILEKTAHSDVMNLWEDI